MPLNIKRNDHCPCKSGKKYKRCCLTSPVQQENSADSSWERIKRIEASVFNNHLQPYAQKLPKKLFKDAKEAFLPNELPDEVDAKELISKFFIPWFIFDWIPDVSPEETEIIPNHTIAQSYLKRYNSRLTVDEKRFIEAMNDSYYSFYGVVEVAFEESVFVIDHLRDTSHLVKEREATLFLTTGSTLYSRILTLDNQSIFVGMAPQYFPPITLKKFLNFKEFLIKENGGNNPTEKDLRDTFDIDTLDYYFKMLKENDLQPRLSLCDPSGKPIFFVATQMDLTIPFKEALYRLLPEVSREELDTSVQKIESDEEGTPSHVKIGFKIRQGKTPEEDFTINIGIFPDKIFIEPAVNFEALKVKKFILETMGDGVTNIMERRENPLEVAQRKAFEEELEKESREKNNAPDLTPAVV